MTLTTQLNTEIARAKAAEKALGDRLANLETPVPVPVPPVPTGTVVNPGDSISPVAGTTYLLRSGTHRLAFGSAERHEANVQLLPYPGEAPVIDGTGLDPHFLYLGAGASWTLGAIALRGFRPIDSGIVAVGDGCTLHALPGFTITGMGGAAQPLDINSHGVYGHGTGTYVLDSPTITGIPGAAVHHYRGTPNGTINGGRLGAFYESALIGSGQATFTGTAFVEPAARWDLQVYTAEGPAAATLTNCTGTGLNGSVRRVG